MKKVFWSKASLAIGLALAAATILGISPNAIAATQRAQNGPATLRDALTFVGQGETVVMTIGDGGVWYVNCEGVEATDNNGNVWRSRKVSSARDSKIAFFMTGDRASQSTAPNVASNRSQALPVTTSQRDTRPRDIVSLISDSMVEARPTGSGIRSVSLGIRRLVRQPLRVRIPVGTFFVSRNSSSQNMVATAEEVVTLNSDDWNYVSVPTACANRSRDIPHSGDSFMVTASPQSQDLVRLMPVLNRAGVEYAIRQAAVWIVTDNASYSSLGVLVRTINGFSAGRIIGANEAARAMRICQEAGIDIRQKAIWRDRTFIHDNVTDTPLRQWIEQESSED